MQTCTTQGSGRRSDEDARRNQRTANEAVGEVDAVVVYSINRFKRSTKDLLGFVDRYVINGALKAALEHWGLSAGERKSTDVGQTGGHFPPLAAIMQE